MEHEFSLNQDRLALIVNNYVAKRKALLDLCLLVFLALFFLVLGLLVSRWLILASLIAWVLVCSSLFHSYRLYKNDRANVIVCSLTINTEGISKLGVSDWKQHFYPWSEISKIIRTDSLYDVSYSRDAEKYGEDVEFHSNDAFLLIFREDSSVGILERTNLELRTTAKGMDYILFVVPKHQLDATEHALRAFSSESVSMYRFREVKFNGKTRTEEYLS